MPLLKIVYCVLQIMIYLPHYYENIHSIMLNKSAVIYVSLGIDLHFYQVIMTFVRYHSTDSKKTNKSAIIHTMEWL